MKHGKKLLSVLLALVMVLALLPSAAFAAEGEKHITILGTSDMHGNIWGFSYEDSKETDNNGMARLYTYIQQVRAENPNTILIDAGDDIQGTIMTDDIYNKIPEEPHPVVAAMNYMGYDAMTLGNHEFNWGIDTMQKILSQAQFPVLAANVKDASGGFVTGAGWTIVEKDGVKVAVIGVVTPDVPIWDGGKAGIEECTYEAAANEKVAFATMFGYSNDWFFANGPELNALTKGDITSKTVLLDDGTAVSQYPGAGNAQSVFGGTLMPEDKAISAVGDTYPVPAVDGIVKITIY